MTSAGRSMKAGSIRPSSGTGHSTRPATSSSRPGSSTTVRCRSAASRGDALGDHPLAFRGIDQDVARAQRRRPVRARAHRERAGRVEAMALGQVGGGQPVPVVGAVAQVERHDRAVQQADDPAQRAHPGERAGAAPAHRFRPGEAAQQVGDSSLYDVDN